MGEALSTVRTIEEQDGRVTEALAREGSRLRNFIRRRVADESDVEDILQDVFSELVETYRLMKPVEHVAAWLFRVARYRIIDLFRKRNTRPLERATAPAPVPNGTRSAGASENPELLSWEDLLPSADGGPEAAYARLVLVEELDAALDELPPEQREVFVAHELDGRSFKELAAETGLSINTLLARKHYAVLHLRRRLQAVHDEIARTSG
jgi:RNA polymerase sigma factor (sigma-70 family)